MLRRLPLPSSLTCNHFPLHHQHKTTHHSSNGPPHLSGALPSPIPHTPLCVTPAQLTPRQFSSVLCCNFSHPDQHPFSAASPTQNSPPLHQRHPRAFQAFYRRHPHTPLSLPPPSAKIPRAVIAAQGISVVRSFFQRSRCMSSISRFTLVRTCSRSSFPSRSICSVCSGIPQPILISLPAAISRNCSP